MPVFIFDRNILDKLDNPKDKRVHFIHKTLEQLQTRIQEHGSSIYILHATPLQAFETICEQFTVAEVMTNHDYEPYAQERDEAVKNFLLQKNIGFTTFKDQVLFEKHEIVKANGTPYTVFTPYATAWKKKYNSQPINAFPSEQHLSHLVKTTPFPFPSLTEIGFSKTNLIISPASVRQELIRNYHLTRNLPAVEGTSRLSVHLRFGTLSVRHLAAMASRLNEQWLNELIWREFFMMILFHFPHVVHQSFKKKYDNIRWRNNEEEFALWCRGETGYPIVDAGMRQLNETGWMHNRVRMITASFLTRHLLIDWRWGEAYFAEKLLDYELAVNNGNWQWAAGCGCDAAPYFRIFNPTTQPQKFDPELRYIKKPSANKPF